mmetsp:Transcript_4733/g.13208  ORF Transcript_4733/g.13208 Transcript_4733/m.13208 type:complete len:245 (+) Transcript_4733:280-1014(+)
MKDLRHVLVFLRGNLGERNPIFSRPSFCASPVQFDGAPLAGHVHLRANDPYDWLKLSSFLRKLLPEHRLETHRLLQRGGFIISHVEANEVSHAILRHGLILVMQGTFVEGERHLQSFSVRLLLLRSLAEKSGCPLIKNQELIDGQDDGDLQLHRVERKCPDTTLTSVGGGQTNSLAFFVHRPDGVLFAEHLPHKRLPSKLALALGEHLLHIGLAGLDDDTHTLSHFGRAFVVLTTFYYILGPLL